METSSQVHRVSLSWVLVQKQFREVLKGLGVEFDIKFVVLDIVGIVEKIGGAQRNGILEN